MYTLLIILALSGSGKYISTTQTEFATKALCEEARSEVGSELNFYDKKTVVCLKTK